MDNLLLTDEEIRKAVGGFCRGRMKGFDNPVEANCNIPSARGVAQAQLAKAEPLIRKDERERIMEEGANYITRNFEWASEEDKKLWKDKLQALKERNE